MRRPREEEPDGTRVPSNPRTNFVLVSETLWTNYHVRRRAIDIEWQTSAAWSDPDLLAGAFTAIRAQRAELLSFVKELAPKMGGTYLIPV